MVLIVDAADGGYVPDLGWARSSREPVAPVTPEEAPASGLAVDTDVDEDPLSMGRATWVGLRQHLADTEAEARSIDSALNAPGLSPAQREAAALACRLHDLGKVHPVFQDTLNRSAVTDTDVALAQASGGPPWAKSGSGRAARHSRRYFRHELASALALLDGGAVALAETEEPDLVVYLVAAHHGRVRLGFRSLPGEFQPDGELDGRTVALGIIDGECLPAAEVPGLMLPETMMDLSVMQMGTAADGRPSWSQRMLPLRDRADLGPFRVGFLEATVRMADWRASAAPGSERKELP